MFTTLFKRPTVEQIHKEFDQAEEKCLQEAEQILQSLNIVTEDKLENKAKMLKELGFVNSEPVKQYDKFAENQEVIKNKYNATKEQVEFIHYLKTKYPLQKFITVDELERICNKYNLIHAPVANYIKDIPEKNVLEMKNIQNLHEKDKYIIQYKAIIEFYRNLWGYESRYCEESETKKFPNSIFVNHEYDTFQLRNHLQRKYQITKNLPIDSVKYEKIDKSGFFIAAPKSHFNLTGLDKKSKYGFFNVTVLEVKDPVVFEYCDKDIVRICSKWGTSDDQSYLDSSLVNETLN